MGSWCGVRSSRRRRATAAAATGTGTTPGIGLGVHVRPQWRQLEATYRSFLEAVAQGRKKTADEIEPLAGGRVWSGRDAAGRGLVDELGGFELALARLRERLGPAGQRAEPVVVGARPMRDLLKALPVPIRVLSRALVRAGVPELAIVAGGRGRERVWAWCEVAEREE